MSQKNKTNKVWGAQWRTGLGVKGWRVLRISSWQNGKLYVTSVGLYAQCSKHIEIWFADIFCRLTIWEQQAHEVLLLYLYIKIYLVITLTIFAKPDAQAGARACKGVIEMMMVMMIRRWHGRRGEIIQFDFLHQKWARHGSHGHTRTDAPEILHMGRRRTHMYTHKNPGENCPEWNPLY